MYYLRARYYDPQTGRFTSFDIQEGTVDASQDLNRYAYCRNNPVKYVDPSGEEVIVLTAATATIIKVAIGAIAAIGTMYTLNKMVSNISDNRKHHILHGSNNSHEKGWKKFNIDPNDPNGFEKLLPIINEVIKNGTKSNWRSVGKMSIREIEYYFPNIGETVRVIINKTAEGIESITDAFTVFK